MYTDARVVHAYRPNDTVTLEELNDELVHLHIPAIVFVICSIVVGSIGNGFVLLVYKKKFRRSNHRYFILFLAALDFLACTTGMPFLVASLRLPYLMNSSVACKINRYCHYLVNNSSGLLLLVISVERFRKICHPMKKQLKTREILYVCYGTIFLSAVIAIPAPIFYEASDIDTKVGNLTGKQCYVHHSVKKSILFETYQAALLMESIICIVVIAILYVLIARKVWTSDQFRNALKMNFNSTVKNAHETSLSTDAHPLDDTTSGSSIRKTTSRPQSREAEVRLLKTLHHLQQPGLLTKSVSCQVVNNISDHSDTVSTNDLHLSASRDHLPKKMSRQNKAEVKRAVSDACLNKLKQAAFFRSLRTPNKVINKTSTDSKLRKARGSQTTMRVTLMLFAVSIIFMIAFVPHLVLMIITVEFDHFLESLNAQEVIVYQVFLRIFILNNIANPIIYLIFDSKFRHACKALITCETRKVKRVT